MAKQTDLNLRSKLIYQIFPRQHSKEQNFEGITKDLKRIKHMGVDIIYLLPIHPIGKKMRKGSIGSPYSILDYYAVDESLGTMDQFIKLVDEAHQLGIKVMMDIVFNHTSRDSVLAKEHPEWFYKNESGDFANRIGDWSDITDLKFDREDVREYFHHVLEYWAKYVDGFRCDVAPLLPIDFWIEARKRIESKYPNKIWLTESVEYGFIKYLRDLGYDASSDSMMYEAFDICYDYDIFSFMDDYLIRHKGLKRWLYEIMRQEAVYPKNYVKLRGFENHDQERLASKTRDKVHTIMMISLMFFLKGTTFLYAGQEHLISKRPDLFENDVIAWKELDSVEPLIKRLSTIKKEDIFSSGAFNWHEQDQEAAIFSYSKEKTSYVGIFDLENLGTLKVPLKDGTYDNLIDQSKIVVHQGFIVTLNQPIIIKIDRENLV